MFCMKCGTPLDADARFCAKCGTATQGTAPAYQSQPAPAAVAAPTYQPGNPSAANVRLAVCLIAIVICAILWFAAPFMAVNLFTMGNQPTALQLVTNDVFALGDITETPAFWAAVISIAGIAICLIGILAKKRILTCIFAVLTDAALVLLVLMMETDLADVIGLGYIGIVILLLVVICFAPGRKKATAGQIQQAPPPAPYGAPPAIAYQPLAAAPQVAQAAAPIPSALEPISNNLCAACGKALGEEEWKCPACGAFRE